MSAAALDEPVLQRFDSIRDDISRLLSSEAVLQDRIKQLEIDLSVYKKVFSETNAEKQRLENEREQLIQYYERQQESLEKQIQVSRVVVLLDGDGAIFVPQLIALGQSGGHKAATMLSDSIKEYILSLDEIRQFQLSVYIFFNRRGLLYTLNRCSYHSARLRLEDFVTGFNQATERFIMVDVGSDKEAADAKIKAFLEDEIRLPQTYKILFGGCHDNGYVTTIRSHITSGFKHKFILLKSYTEHAAGFDDLELPILSIPGLFISQKLVTSSQGQDPPATSSTLSPPLYDTPITETPPSSLLGRSDVYQPAHEMGNHSLGFSSPAMYSNLSLNKAERYSTVGSETTSDYGVTNENGHFNYNCGTRRLDPQLGLAKHNPPPCTRFYLARHCKYGTTCKYGHDYILEPEHYAEMKANAKKAPCPAVNKNEDCTFGDFCCYGHVCPHGTKCYFFKKGKCKFTRADMHKGPEGL
ncbi:hypothetical protein P691DRAFT_698817 [Macrolepiota fuliginosa MF-IS2]|uniref:C3H1-type domain-containing protein n=1 Tax=Macrolepiota fuliginosa MF-IS2 TaxID=1400762 RepID=A0A9P6C785_9AGAR|nr:hypothetical protein P691DRAFT_698817 [Macrolepiota fuliginosa MF-IS2]